MKKQHLKILTLNKKSISNLNDLIGGAAPAQTCEGPCQGGTGCCEADGERHTMQIGPVCTIDPNSISWIVNVCDCLSI
jgi:hypothetical protein